MPLSKDELGRLRMRRLDDAIAEAVRCRKQLARTFSTSVGVAFEMYDGKIIGGFNVETYAHKGYHAEEVGLIRALAEGYNGTDFVGMVEVFQAREHDKVEIYPACPSCWFWLNEFAHPDLEIVVADTSGTPHYVCKLRDCLHPPAPGEVFPSRFLNSLAQRSNIQPKNEKVEK